jgi:hypothetical protein
MTQDVTQVKENLINFTKVLGVVCFFLSSKKNTIFPGIQRTMKRNFFHGSFSKMNIFEKEPVISFFPSLYVTERKNEICMEIGFYATFTKK